MYIHGQDLPLTRLYLSASLAACSRFPQPGGPSKTTRGVCGATERWRVFKNPHTERWGSLKHECCDTCNLRRSERPCMKQDIIFSVIILLTLREQIFNWLICIERFTHTIVAGEERGAVSVVELQFAVEVGLNAAWFLH